MAVLRIVAIRALHALFGMDRHEMHRLARIGARFDKFGFILAAEFLRIVIVDNIAVLIEQIALAVAFEDRAEIPSVPVIVGKLRVFELRIEVIDIAQKIEISP